MTHNWNIWKLYGFGKPNNWTVAFYLMISEKKVTSYLIEKGLL
jgi:hypothetical protein